MTVLLVLSLMFRMYVGSAQTETAFLEGMVLEAGTDRPLLGVQISMPTYGSRPITTSTDSEGRFRFEDVEPGHYRLSAEKEGYARARVSSRKFPGNAGIPVTLTAGEPVRGLQIRMVRGGVITGRVFDTAGRPVVRAIVGANRYRYDENGYRALSALASTYTNDRGEYRLFGLDAGDYYISVSPAWLEPAAQDEAYVQVYYPGFRDPAGAVPVTVSAGNEVRVEDITLLSVKAVPVRLRITNMTGMTPQITNIELRQEGKPVSMNVGFAGVRDSFEIPAVPAGVYEIAVGLAEGAVFPFARFEIAVGETPIEKEVIVSRGWPVRGRILLQSADGTIRPVSRTPVALRVSGSAQGGSATTANDGTFIIQGITAGHYWARLPGLAQDQYVIAVLEDGRDVTAEGVRIAGETSVDILLGASGGIVEGSVTNAAGEHMSDSVVALVPDGPLRSRQHLYRMANTDQNGAFVIRGVAPGKYHLFAWPELEGPAFRNEDFLEEYENNGIAVNVDAGDRLRVNPPLLEDDSTRP